MSLSAHEIGLLVEELEGRTVGLRIQKIFQLDVHTFLLSLTGKLNLLISVHPQASRIHSAPLGSDRIPCRDFCRLLRKHLTGGVVDGLNQVGSDRLVRISARRGDDRFLLVAELMGRAANLVLLDGEERVIGAIKPSGSSGRRFRAGEPYCPPTRPSGRTLKDATRFDSESGSVDLQARLHYETWLGSYEWEKVRAHLGRQARKAVKRLRARERRTSADREKAEARLVHQKWADLLLAHLHQLPKQALSAAVPDLFGQEEPIEIPLDPSVTVKDNAQRYYKSSRRARRTLEATSQQLEEVRKKISQLEDFLNQLETAGPDESVTLEAEAAGLGLKARTPVTGRPRAERPARLPYRSFRSLTGRVILVGRTARDNHQLSFHVARGRDLWLHVTDAPGPHVIVRLETSQPVDQETLLDAAVLAVHFSSARRSRVAEVRYALRKHVRAIRGSPGRVTVAGGKTLTLRMDPERLKRLLEVERDS
jgi:predicted ribosome quality control (RQC) complex YloA/Tae2 family protein